MWFYALIFAGCHGQSEHFHKRVLTLDSCGINCAGTDGEIASTCPNIEELDLAKNNLSDFQEVRISPSCQPSLMALLPPISYFSIVGHQNKSSEGHRFNLLQYS